MKVSVAQNRPVIGNIPSNIESHKKLIELAASEGAGMVIFPELSLSGYEPKIAAEVATTINDERFEQLQQLSDRHKIVIGAGVPVKQQEGITITMIIFQPDQPRRTYSKKYLHEDEVPYFIPGQNFQTLTIDDTKISLAICYEISVPEHAQAAAAQHPVIYIASVAKFKRHMEQTISTLAGTAKNYSIITMMANCLGVCDGEECVGSSAAINTDGSVIGQLDDRSEGVLTLDLKLKTITKRYL